MLGTLAVAVDDVDAEGHDEGGDVVAQNEGFTEEPTGNDDTHNRHQGIKNSDFAIFEEFDSGHGMPRGIGTVQSVEKIFSA